MQNLESGYIDKEVILSKISEEEIFKHIFGEIPDLGKKYVSPFRNDNNPGCFFKYDRNDKLRFYDYATNEVINGINLGYVDCFDALQLYLDLSNLYQTIVYIEENLVGGSTLKSESALPPKDVKVKQAPSEFLIRPRDYTAKDIKYWKQYGISTEDLKQDRVLSISKMIMLKEDKILVQRFKTELAFCFTDFDKDKRKLYFPYSKYRFLTNCDENDIGNINNIDFSDNSVIYITKSYKDSRVMINSGLRNTLWLQNETVLPQSEEFFKTLNCFHNVRILYDSDKAGIKGAQSLLEYLSSRIFSKISLIHLPPHLYSKFKIKDVSDLYKEVGVKEYQRIMKEIL